MPAEQSLVAVNPASTRDQGGDRGSAKTAFWVGFPIALGLFAGWNQIGMVAPALPLAWSMIYWVLLSALMWCGLGLGTAMVARSGARLAYPAILVIGAAVGIALTRPAHATFQQLFQPLTIDPSAVSTLPAFPTTAADWILLYSGNAMLMAFWIGGALFFAAFIGYAPFGRYANGASQDTGKKAEVASAALRPRIATRLTKLDFDEVEAVRAEDHYLRVLGCSSEEMILYRFADAVEELEPFGWVRVHRSWSVDAARIADVRPHGRGSMIVMWSGREVPVSERHYGIVQRAVAQHRNAGVAGACKSRAFTSPQPGRRLISGQPQAH